jgi:hypothetical protein
MENTSYLLFVCALFCTCFLQVSADETVIHFTEQTDAAGIRFRHINGASEHKYLPETMGSGCLFFDYDNDGYLDIFLVNSGRSCENASQPRSHSDEMNALYRIDILPKLKHGDS